jgi:hydroxyethylthiazole kinase
VNRNSKEEILINEIGGFLREIRSRQPLVHHITNYVTVNDCANIVLAIGASLIMADDIDEVKSIVSISSALVLNIGTLNGRTIESMIAAGQKANELNIPVIFDPVGAGASELRNRTTEKLMEKIKISVLRGNMSEIRFVAGLESETKGVDVSASDLASGLEIRRELAANTAKKFTCVTAITGEKDIISDGGRELIIENGTKMLSNVTGTGCMCSSLVGAFCSVTRDYLIAAAGGILSVGIAGESP